MPRRNRAGGVGACGIDNSPVVAETCWQIVEVPKRNVESGGGERSLTLPRDELAIPPHAHGRRHSRPDNWNSVAVIDDVNVLSSVEESTKPRVQSRPALRCDTDSSKSFSFDRRRELENRRLVTSSARIAFARGEIHRARVRERRHDESSSGVGRCRPAEVALWMRVCRLHSSPMSHACSRSFFEYARNAVNVCVLFNPGTCVMCSVTTVATPS